MDGNILLVHGGEERKRAAIPHEPCAGLAAAAGRARASITLFLSSLYHRLVVFSHTGVGGKESFGYAQDKFFARPRFPPPPNFVFRFAKCAARNPCLHFLIFGVALK